MPLAFASAWEIVAGRVQDLVALHPTREIRQNLIADVKASIGKQKFSNQGTLAVTSLLHYLDVREG